MTTEAIEKLNLHNGGFDLRNYSYQELLAKRLYVLSGEFDQYILNENVIRKISRYVEPSKKALLALDEIDLNVQKLNKDGIVRCHFL